ncbi:MAG TPA: M56 family metallopeptidase [Rhizomicrobium sp.]|nr:M56 family metallopeptidase [Rhizomicrobium sp.]
MRWADAGPRARKSKRYATSCGPMRTRTMTEIGAWLPPGIVLALGWSLIHSLWQDLVIAALAALLMALSRRPSTRYLVGVTALALMPAAAAATFLVFFQDASFTVIAAQSAVSPSHDFISHSLPAAPQIRLTPFAAGHWPIAGFMPMLVKAWLIGVALFTLRLVCGLLLLEQKRRWHSRPLAGRFLDLCREVQERLGLTRVVRYLECDWLHAPAVIGWLRPVVLLPVAALTGLSEDQLRAVIAHELAHIRRLDWVVNLLQTLVEALFFYHPAVWWLGRRIRIERERCCDEIAVSVYGNRLEYARALGLMGEWRSAPRLAMAANRGPLSERILGVLGHEPAGQNPRAVALAAGLLLLMSVLSVSRVMPGSVFPIHTSKAGALVHALVQQKALPIREIVPDTHPKSEIAVTQSRRDMGEAVPPLSPGQQKPLTGTYRVHANALPVTTVGTPDVPVVLAPIAEDKPAPQVESPSAAVSAASDTLSTDQPTGSGDPNAVVCRQPEHLPGSQAMGPRLCLKNIYWSALWVRGKTLSADGKTVLEPASAPIVDKTPDGTGNPEQVVCAKPQVQSASRLLTSVLCFRNAYWAQLRRSPARSIDP